MILPSHQQFRAYSITVSKTLTVLQSLPSLPQRELLEFSGDARKVLELVVLSFHLSIKAFESSWPRYPLWALAIPAPNTKDKNYLHQKAVEWITQENACQSILYVEKIDQEPHTHTHKNKRGHYAVPLRWTRLQVRRGDVYVWVTRRHMRPGKQTGRDCGVIPPLWSSNFTPLAMGRGRQKLENQTQRL